MENLSGIKVLILCGGQGSRLHSLALSLPKPLLSFAEKPFLTYLIRFLVKQGLESKQLILLIGHQAEIFKTTLKYVSFSEEKVPLGTGGAIALAMKHYPADKYLVMNGDTLFFADYLYFYQQALELFKSYPHLKMVMGVKELFLNERYGLVRFDKNGLLEAYEEKKAGRGFINTGIYIMRKEIQKDIGPEMVSLENKVFKDLVEKKEVGAVVLVGDFLDIGTPEDYAKAKALIPQWELEGRFGITSF